MCWGKWFKTLRKQSFILEGLFTWDNKLLPRKGAIHKETPQPRIHWLECASAIMGPWWMSSTCIQHGWAVWVHAYNGVQLPWAAKLPTWEPYPRSDGLMEPRNIPEFSYKPVHSKRTVQVPWYWVDIIHFYVKKNPLNKTDYGSH